MLGMLRLKDAKRIEIEMKPWPLRLILWFEGKRRERKRN